MRADRMGGEVARQVQYGGRRLGSVNLSPLLGFLTGSRSTFRAKVMAFF